MPSDRTIQRFWNSIDKSGECWLWTRPTNGGYGRLQVDGVSVYAHRFAYEIEVGRIPDGLCLDHLCRVRNCVRPSHLEPVAFRMNVLRGEGPTAINARKTHCPRGHELSDENLTARARRDCRICAIEAARSIRLDRLAERVGDFPCPECGAQFSGVRGVRTHVARRHGDTP